MFVIFSDVFIIVCATASVATFIPSFTPVIALIDFEALFPAVPVINFTTTSDPVLLKLPFSTPSAKTCTPKATFPTPSAVAAIGKVAQGRCAHCDRSNC